MKKATSIILMALVLVMGLTQCKKNNDINTADNEGEKVYITLMVNQGNGSRLDVDPPHVTFENGDKIYVASNGKYVGTLTHNGTTFEGEISSATEGQPLYFYLLGNVTPAETLTAGTTTTCSVNISDQTGDLPVIACAPSDQNFGATNNFTATLRNKCALVKFNVTTSSSLATCLEGFNNKVTVTFGSTDMAYAKEGNGLIKLAAGNGERWAILLPQNALAQGAEGSAHSEDGLFEGIRPAIPAIEENSYLTVALETVIATDLTPEGVVKGLFTINENGGKVFFSKGNLQYIGSASTPYWKFADHQWDYFGNTTGQNSTNQNVDRDLFCWGTSGYSHGAVCYQPWIINGEESDYYAYGNANYGLDAQTGQADWGYNPISNGGNTANQWRTLTAYEWDYLIWYRTTSSIRYAMATVNNVKGVILLPDIWSSSYVLNSTTYFNDNIVSSSQWAVLESSGAVFLPAAGTCWTNFGYGGGYWGSNVEVGAIPTYPSEFSITNGSISVGYWSRRNGFSVRLVRDVQ